RTQACSSTTRLALKNCTSPSLRLKLTTKRKQASTSSLGSGKPAPSTRIHPLIGGAMKSSSPPDIPSVNEHGLALCRPKAAWTARKLRLLIASQQPGRHKNRCRKLESANAFG